MKTLLQRFEEKWIPVPEAGCWLWLAGVSSEDYGKFRVGEQMLEAHRVSYELYRGPIPTGLDIDHLCRVHCCVNPWHLEPVTRQVNLLRGHPGAWMKGRARDPQCRNGHTYTPATTKRRERDGARICLLCARDALHRYRERLRVH